MEKKKILWISPCAPSRKASHAGGQTFYYYFRRFADDNRFEIRLICSDEDIDTETFESEFGNCEHRIFRKNVGKRKKIGNLESKYNLWNKHAGMLSNYYAGEILKACRAYEYDGYRPDIVILEWTGIVLMAAEISEVFPLARLVASEVDVTYIGYDRKRRYYKGMRKLLWNQKYKWEKQCELRSLRYCDLILPQNPDNISSLREEGIDEGKMMWLAPFFNNMKACRRTPGNRRDVLFYGAMGRRENHLTAIWIIDNIAPLLEDINVRFIFLGSNPRPELKALENDRILVTGYVEDVVPFFESSVCLIAPLVLGAGIKVKILEGFSSGIPVLTNDIGIEGIPAKAGKEYIHCDSAEEYARAVRRACYGGLDEVGIAGRRFVNEKYDLQGIYDAYQRRLLELI